MALYDERGGRFGRLAAVGPRAPAVIAFFMLAAACGSEEPATLEGQAPQCLPFDVEPAKRPSEEVGPGDGSQIEVGLLDLPPQPGGESSEARMFYVYKPALDGFETKPLLVLSNGGPGSATSSILLAYGTGDFTLTDEIDSWQSPRPNPASLRNFANLLYLDERGVGFSYLVGAAPASDAPWQAPTPLGDAADFVTAILRFLRERPRLRAAPVVFLGESYAGTRFTLALDLLLHHDEYRGRLGAPLEALIDEHFASTFAGTAPAELGPARIAEQFGRQAFIQPALYPFSKEEERALMRADPYLGAGIDDLALDGYNLTLPFGSTAAFIEAAHASLQVERSRLALFGVDPLTLFRLRPPGRGQVFRRNDGDFGGALVCINDRLQVEFGNLAPGDAYYTNTGGPFLTSIPSGEMLFVPEAFDAFARNLRFVKTFITRARHDSVVYTPAILEGLRRRFEVVHDEAPRPGVERPGWFSVSLPPNEARPDEGAEARVEVRFPPYVESGHTVTITQAPAFADDLKAWLSEPLLPRGGPSGERRGGPAKTSTGTDVARLP
jgi:hypothetical protein